MGIGPAVGYEPPVGIGTVGFGIGAVTKLIVGPCGLANGTAFTNPRKELRKAVATNVTERLSEMLADDN